MWECYVNWGGWAGTAAEGQTPVSDHLVCSREWNWGCQLMRKKQQPGTAYQAWGWRCQAVWQ